MYTFLNTIKKFLYSSPAFIVPAIINLISLLVFTRSLTLESYGKLSLALITMEFLQGVIFQWIKSGMMRFYEVDPHASNQYLALSIKLIGFAILFLMFISLILMIWNKFYGIQDFAFYILIVFGTISRGLHYFILDYLRISRNTLKAYTIFALLSNIAFYIPGNCYALLNKNTSDIHFILFLQIGVSLVFFLIYLIPKYKNIFSQITTSIKNSAYAEFLQYGTPLILVVIASSMFVRIDRYILEYNVGLSQLGAYSASFSLSNLALSSFFTILTLPTYPQIIKQLNYGNDEEAKLIFYRNGNFILLIALPIIFIFLAFNSFFCKLFFAEKGLQVESIFPYVLIGTFFYNLKVHYFDQTYQFAKRTKVLMSINILVGIIHLMLGYLLSKQLGSKGVAISAIGLNIIGIIFTYFYCQNLFQIKFDKFVIAGAGIATVLLMLFKLFYSHYF
jgi:O-antigen/teichoic acid export membrane protein